MTPLPFDQTGAGILFGISVIAFVALEVGIRVVSQVNRGAGRGELASLVAVAGGIAVGVVGAVLVSTQVTSAAIPFLRWPIFIFGILLIALGIAVRLWSVVSLGRYFTVDVRVRPDQKVVDRGPYRWVRHPSYTGLLLSVAGIGVSLGNWLSIVIAIVVPFAVIAYRIRVEERALAAGIGEPYREFMATRKRLIPHLW